MLNHHVVYSYCGEPVWQSTEGAGAGGVMVEVLILGVKLGYRAWHQRAGDDSIYQRIRRTTSVMGLLTQTRKMAAATCQFLVLMWRHWRTGQVQRHIANPRQHHPCCPKWNWTQPELINILFNVVIQIPTSKNCSNTIRMWRSHCYLFFTVKSSEVNLLVQ